MMNQIKKDTEDIAIEVKSASDMLNALKLALGNDTVQLSTESIISALNGSICHLDRISAELQNM